MIFTEFRNIISKRAAIDEEWYTEIKKCWEEMIEIFSADIEKTNQFLSVCSGDEFAWLSEIFEGIASKTKSADFIAALRSTSLKYPSETRQYNISEFIDSAETIVTGEQE